MSGSEQDPRKEPTVDSTQLQARLKDAGKRFDKLWRFL